MSRCIQLFLLLAGLSIAPAIFGNNDEERSLAFFHTHTGESLQVTYYRQGAYDPAANLSVRIFLADWRDGKQYDIDPKVLDILWQIQQVSGETGIWEVISAYRSPETNKMLRSKSSGVAKKSQHLEGNAIDVRYTGLGLEVLRDTARSLKLGGVGYYPGPDFVHVDTGRVRYW